MSCPKGTALPPSGPSVAHWDRYKCLPPQLKNESRTNRGRIADSELSNFVHGHISGCRHHRPPDQVFCREYLERSTLSSRIEAQECLNRNVKSVFDVVCCGSGRIWNGDELCRFQDAGAKGRGD